LPIIAKVINLPSILILKTMVLLGLLDKIIVLILTLMRFIMVETSSYSVKNNHLNGRQKLITEEVFCCPDCNRKMIRCGTKDRTYIDADGEKNIIILLRVKCKECRKTHVVLPDFLIPKRRHCRETIERIIDIPQVLVPVIDLNNPPTISMPAVEMSTIYRVKKWFSSKAQYFSLALTAIIKRNPELEEEITPYINCWTDPERKSGWTKKIVQWLVFAQFF
jgi:hypothetical protein